MIIWKVEGDGLHYFKTKEQAKLFMSLLDQEMSLHRIDLKNTCAILRELRFAADYQQSA